jgi:Uma2 family endonuclease
VVIQVDLTNPPLAKFPIFAQLGVPEVWCYDGRQWQILQLVGEEYVKQVQTPEDAQMAVKRPPACDFVKESAHG